MLSALKVTVSKANLCIFHQSLILFEKQILSTLLGNELVRFLTLKPIVVTILIIFRINAKKITENSQQEYKFCLKYT